MWCKIDKLEPCTHADKLSSAGYAAASSYDILLLPLLLLLLPLLLLLLLLLLLPLLLLLLLLPLLLLLLPLLLLLLLPLLVLLTSYLAQAVAAANEHTSIVYRAVVAESQGTPFLYLQTETVPYSSCRNPGSLQ